MSANSTVVASPIVSPGLPRRPPQNWVVLVHLSHDHDEWNINWCPVLPEEHNLPMGIPVLINNFFQYAHFFQHLYSLLPVRKVKHYHLIQQGSSTFLRLPGAALAINVPTSWGSCQVVRPHALRKCPNSISPYSPNHIFLSLCWRCL